MRMRKNIPTPSELLALGKIARVDSYPCGHVVLSVESLRIGFTRTDFVEFAQTVALAAENLENKELLRAEWGLFF